MFDKDIEFSAHEDYFALKEDYPIPAKLNIPEWYKKLEHSLENKTIKGCIPFLDTLTSGYIFKMPQDFYVKHNVENKYNLKDSFQTFGLHDQSQILHAKNINLNSGVDNHSIKQVEGSHRYRYALPSALHRSHCERRRSSCLRSSPCRDFKFPSFVGRKRIHRC
jgi:hypothetical protein